MKETRKQRSTTYFTKLIAVSVGHFSNDFYMNLIPPILFLFVQELGLSLAEQAFIAFVITSSGSFAQPIIGYFVDKRGKPWLVILSLVWISFWMSISGIITNYYLLVIILGLGALASALFHPLGSAMAVKLGKKSRGKSLSVFMTIGGFAASVSPMIAIPIVKAHGLKVLVFFMIPGILVALFLYLAQVQKVDMNQMQVNKEEKREKFDFHSAKWVSVLVFISTNKVLIKIFLITFGAQIMLSKQVDIKIAGVILSIYLLANSLGTIIGGYLNDIIGSKKVLVLFNVLAPLCMMLIVFTTGIPMVIGFLFMGITLSGSNTANIVMAHELMPENLNVATGLIMGLSGGLGGLLMLLFGKIADIQGLITSASYLLVPLILVTLLTILLPNEKSRINQNMSS
ncbi:MAG: MFS transporter [Clostridiaceae bacterium]|nr:MFS transporter [Clostridiaceae bacterium]